MLGQVRYGDVRLGQDRIGKDIEVRFDYLKFGEDIQASYLLSSIQIKRFKLSCIQIGLKIIISSNIFTFLSCLSVLIALNQTSEDPSEHRIQQEVANPNEEILSETATVLFYYYFFNKYSGAA